MITRDTIVDAYLRMRSSDHTIPDTVLDFMKGAALDKLAQTEALAKPYFYILAVEVPTKENPSVELLDTYGYQTIGNIKDLLQKYWLGSEGLLLACLLGVNNEINYHHTVGSIDFILTENNKPRLSIVPSVL